nr:PAS domain-containing protein [Bacteroidales bacterium]
MQVLESSKNIDNIDNIIFNNSHIGITICKPTGIFITVNDKVSQLSGYGKEELYQYSSSILTHPADIKKENEKLIDATNKNKKDFEIEKRLIKQNGEIIWVNAHTEIH